MVRSIKIGDPELEVRLRSNSRARRMILRVGRVGGVTTLTAPPGVSEEVARRFIQTNAEWLKAQVAASRARTDVGEGTVLPFRGETVVVRCGAAACRIRSGALELTAPPERAGRMSEAVLRELAREACVSAAAGYAAHLGKRPSRISIRDPRGRWGSCNERGDLMFSWRLIMAPAEVLDYVAAHEAAHLAEMNHSPRFWRVVAQLYPGFQKPRRWLKLYGADLHAYNFRTDSA